MTDIQASTIACADRPVPRLAPSLAGKRNGVRFTQAEVMAALECHPHLERPSDQETRKAIDSSQKGAKGGAPRTISTNTPLPPPPVPRTNAAHSVPFRIPSPPFPAADTTNWSEFTPEHAASPELLAQFTAACAAKYVMVNAAANAKGAVVITKATRSAGAPASVVPWDVVKAVARTVFGHCTSVAAVKGGRATIESHGEQLGNGGRKSSSDSLDEILSCSLLTPLLAHAQVPKGKTT